VARIPGVKVALFLVLGVGTEIVAILELLAFFRRRGWL
jgi:hypothetical protein